jgi:quaternary ammonium compound-resistance protein SugE
MAWVYLVLAGLFEVGFASTIKLTNGFTKLVPSIIFLVCATASFMLLSRAVRELPISTAYAVWTGIGAAGTAVVGILLYKEPASALKILCLATLIASVVGLKFASSQ